MIVIIIAKLVTISVKNFTRRRLTNYKVILNCRNVSKITERLTPSAINAAMLYIQG